MPRPASPGADGKDAGPSSREGVAAEGVGEEDAQGAQGFHVGLAPANLRPPMGVDTGMMLYNTAYCDSTRGCKHSQ